MTQQVPDYVSQLNLRPHPEGGSYREIHRSALKVQELESGEARTACTTIYYLLRQGEVSRFHRIAQEESWHFYDGGDLELICASGDLQQIRRVVLGKEREESRFVFVVPAGWWQAARPIGAYSLVGCTVAPGFEFSGFQLMRDNEAVSAQIREFHPELANWL